MERTSHSGCWVTTGLVLVSLAGGCRPELQPGAGLTSPGPHAAKASHALLGADPAPERSGVGALYVTDSGEAELRCSAVLVGRRTALTARHCVQRAGESEERPAGQISVAFGTGAQASDLTRRDVLDLRVLPGSYEIDQSGLLALADRDLALLQIATVEVPPVQLELGGVEGWASESLTLVGFGRDEEGQAGVRRAKEISDYQLLEKSVELSEAICVGDSGGPVLSAEGRVVAIHSVGSEGCGTGVTRATRLDVHAKFLLGTLADLADCDGQVEVCDGVDNDCDGRVDQGCVSLGEACAMDSDCESEACESIAGEKRCVAICDLFSGGDSCPAGLRCQRVTDCTGVCTPGEAGSVARGLDCTLDEDCASGRCDAEGGPGRVCQLSCREDGDGCAAGESCRLQGEGCGFCEAIGEADTPEQPGGFGESCSVDRDCRGDLCARDGALLYCSSACVRDADCTPSAHCRSGLCVRGKRGSFGDGCQLDEDCGGELYCAVRGTGPTPGWCTGTCDEAMPCAQGHCVDFPEGPLCAPTQGLPASFCEEFSDCDAGGCIGGICAPACQASVACPAGTECFRSSDGVTGWCLSEQVETHEVESTPIAPLGSCGAALVGKRATNWWVVLLSLVAFVWVRSRSIMRERD